MTFSPEPTSFIVAEHGAEPVAWARRFAVGTPSTLTIAQACDEAPMAFAIRVRSTVAAFVAGGGVLARAVLVGGGGGASLLASRSLALRALVTSMAAQGEGTMLLDGPGADRFAMMALASTVAGQVAGTGVTVASTAATIADVA